MFDHQLLAFELEHNSFMVKALRTAVPIQFCNLFEFIGIASRLTIAAVRKDGGRLVFLYTVLVLNVHGDNGNMDLRGNSNDSEKLPGPALSILRARHMRWRRQ